MANDRASQSENPQSPSVPIGVRAVSGLSSRKFERNFAGGQRSDLRRVLIASAAGATFESYDLALFGPMAALIAANFFSGLDSSAAYVFTLLSFAVGYLVRPLGGIFFGRLGDLAGRKYSFVITIVILGASTVAMGLLPSYSAIGTASPALMMLLRVLQGLAFGGEFGSAVSYIAEHARTGSRGVATSAVAITSACGLVLAILVVLSTEWVLGKSAFEAWGWRIPFLFSAILMLISLYMRVRLQESPVFLSLRTEGQTSSNPLREAFGIPRYLRQSVLAMLGAVAGSSVAVAVGAYPIYFLMLNLKIDPFLLHYTILGYSALFAVFIIAAAWLSDRAGRKPLILSGFLLTALFCYPIFKAITHFADPALEAAVRNAPVQVLADPVECTVQIDPIGVMQARTSCDIARKALAKAGIPYARSELRGQISAQIVIGAQRIPVYEGRNLSKTEFETQAHMLNGRLAAALEQAGYPAKADPHHTNVGALIALLALLNLFVALCSGPLAAWLVELFPTKIRDTALSVAYNFGAWFGGFLPTIAFTAFTVTGNFYAGLWYAIVVLVCSAVVGAMFLPETRGRSLRAIE